MQSISAILVPHLRDDDISVGAYLDPQSWYKDHF